MYILRQMSERLQEFINVFFTLPLNSVLSLNVGLYIIDKDITLEGGAMVET